MEKISEPAPYHGSETAEALRNFLGFCAPGHWEVLREPQSEANDGFADIEFLNGAVRKSNLAATFVLRSELIELPAQYDFLNVGGGTEVMITDANLSDKDGSNLGKTAYIELFRPSGKHHFIEVLWPEDDEKSLTVYDYKGDILPPSEETERLIDGLILWGEEAYARYEAI